MTNATNCGRVWYTYTPSDAMTYPQLWLPFAVARTSWYRSGADGGEMSAAGASAGTRPGPPPVLRSGRTPPRAAAAWVTGVCGIPPTAAQRP
jgi:hypothetical protein